MPLPNYYQIAVSRPLATYDFFTVIEGTGMVEFDAFNTASSGAVTYNLGKDVSVYSYEIATNNSDTGITSSTFAVQKTIDWDLSSFNFPKVVTGTAYINGTFAIEGSAGQGATGYAEFFLYHYDGTTNTQLGTTRTENIIAASAGDAIKIFTQMMTLTEKKFNPGDKLRLRCNLWARKDGASNNCNIRIGNDPQNRADGTITPTTTYPTTLKLWVPFKADL